MDGKKNSEPPCCYGKTLFKPCMLCGMGWDQSSDGKLWGCPGSPQAVPGTSRGRTGVAQGWDVQGSCPAGPGIPFLATHKRNTGKQ